jgi:hypothetical protein
MLKMFMERIREKERRKFFLVYLGGKMGGLAVAIAGADVLTKIFGQSAAHAQDGTDLPQESLINATNTMWTLIAAFLVFFMQAGFMMLEAGFARTRETVNILLECIVDTALCGILFWAIGFAFMFGRGNGWIGHEFFFLNGAPATYGSTGSSCSSSPSPTPARPSPRAPWSAARASWATSSTRSASPPSSTRSSATGSGAPMAGSPP